MSRDNTKLSLKVMFNKHKSKVLFAEANTDFVEILLSFLTLPLGKLVTNIRKHYGDEAPAIGSLNTLHQGLANLDSAHFSLPGAKEMLLNPETSFRAECRNLAIDISSSLRERRYYVCEDWECPKSAHKNISLYSDIAKCACGGSLKTVMELLKFSLTSATPLTDVIIKKTQTSFTAATGPETFLPDIQRDDHANPRNLVLQVCLQKSTNKFLFAVATAEFVELLLSFLTVPLGGVEFLLRGNTGLKNIDNLYRSVTNGIDDKYFESLDIKNRLINPKVAQGFFARNDQFLPLSEASPTLYFDFKKNEQKKKMECSFSERDGSRVVRSFNLNEEISSNYVKKQTMCFVKDDLTLSPNLESTFSILDGLGIPFSDVIEMDLQIGLKEALGILKASLISKTALTDALITPMLNKRVKLERQPKQEP
ncbi:uncharacterized protein LOC131009994 [Salvia miltiorrhiza]|uniref:uncharacterized protein LOC131009994 n=1 Tax=Salvia miltiorrhiza TaxID=226208 RepID=UPI0025AD568D|nr:uncharacterized protein LOC131009994 [Salvia miltiorrhiza]